MARLILSLLGWTLDLDLAPTPVAPDEDESPAFYGETSSGVLYEDTPVGFTLPSTSEEDE